MRTRGAGARAKGLRRRLLSLSPRARALLVLGIGALVAIGAATAIGKVAEFDEVRSALESADPRWLALCLLGEVFAYLGYILMFRDVVRVDGGARIDIGTTTQAVFVSFGALALANAPGGLATNFWIFHESGASPEEAARRLLGLNTLLYAVFGAAGFAAALALLIGTGDVAPLGMQLPWLLAIPPCVAAALLVSSARLRDRLTRTEGRGWLGKSFATAVGGVILVRHLLGTRPVYPGAAIGAPLHWAGDLVCLWAALRAFGVELSVAALVLAYATGYVATIIPLPAGGAGAIDASMAFALTLVGVPLAVALLATFTYRFFTFWIEIPPALAVAPTVPGLRRKLIAAQATRTDAASTAMP